MALASPWRLPAARSNVTVNTHGGTWRLALYTCYRGDLVGPRILNWIKASTDRMEIFANRMEVFADGVVAFPASTVEQRADLWKVKISGRHTSGTTFDETGC